MTPTDAIRELLAHPGTVLVARVAEGWTDWTEAVVEPTAMTPLDVPIYTTSWGEPDQDGLSAQVRTYITHQEARRRAAVAAHELGDATDDEIAAAVANTLRGAGDACFQRARRGDDALTDELLDDPAAVNRYTA